MSRTIEVPRTIFGSLPTNSRRSQSHLLPRRNQSPSHHPHALTHTQISLKMGNGAKAQQKRERNAKDTSTKGSQLKAVRNQEKRRRRQSIDEIHGRSTDWPTDLMVPIQNAAAKTIKCKVCFQDFQSTAKRPALEQHADSRHSKKYEECFEG